MTTLMGAGSRRTYAATLLPDRFYCLLDELPLHLLPRVARGALRVPDDQILFMNPECIVCPASALPVDLHGFHELSAAFDLQSTIAWVRDPDEGTLLPFWLGPELEGVVRGLEPGQPAPKTLPSETRNLLSAAGILVAEGSAALRRQERDRIVSKARPLFRQRGYAPLGGLIHPFHVAALRRYYRFLIRTGVITLGDKQSPRRYVAYNEPVAQFFHKQIANKVSAVVGEAIKPSYVYLASYLSGAELKKHTDRVQCEYSVTLCLDFSPEPRLGTPWPIQLETPNRVVKVYQALGDGLVYRGTRLPHFRDKLAEGQTSTSIFFHYVAEDFEGSLD